MTSQPTAPPEVDWELLRREAVAVMGRAYAPYSKYPVGAAALVYDGRIITGCNVENACYGLGLCAECGLVGAAATGGGRLVALVCLAGEGDLLMPCGRCRQLIYEYGGPELLVAAEGGPITVAGLLPEAFGPQDLAALANKAAGSGPGLGADYGMGWLADG